MREFLKGRLYSGYHFNIRKKDINNLNLSERTVLLYRIRGTEIITISRIVKICRKRNGEIRYILPMKKGVLRELDISGPCNLEIEILDKKPRGYKPVQARMRKCIDIISLLNDKSFTCIPYENKLYIFCQGGGIGGSSFVSVPRHLVLDDSLFWNIGFYLAEGLKTNNNRISVSNSEWYLIRRFMDFLDERLDINISSLYLYIRVSDKKKELPSIAFWSEKLGIDKSQIRASIPRMRPPRTKFGNAELVFYNTALSRLFMSLFSWAISSNLNREDTLSLIRGIEAGDGYIMEHGGIEIGVVSNNELAGTILRLFRKIFKDMRIRDHHTSDNAKIIYCKGRRVATEFLLDGHFKEHEKRRARLTELLRYYLRKDINYLRLFEKKKSTKDISEECAITYRAANIMLKKLESNGYLNRSFSEVKNINNERRYRTRTFGLSRKGEQLLKYMRLN